MRAEDDVLMIGKQRRAAKGNCGEKGRKKGTAGKEKRYNEGERGKENERKRKDE